jgi:hypothetical protein
MGLRVSAVAGEYTTDGLVGALVALFASQAESAPAIGKGNSDA